MGSVLVLIYGIPIVVTLLSIPVFRALAEYMGIISFGITALLVVGFFAFWSIEYRTNCEMSASGTGDTGCGFVGFLEPMIRRSFGAAAIGAVLVAIFTFRRLNRREPKNG